MKVKIENQLFFAEVMKLKSEDSLVEHAKWDGYCQGLKYCLGVLSGQVIAKASSSSDEKHTTVDMKRFYDLERGDGKECVCSPADLEPFGECQCGKQVRVDKMKNMSIKQRVENPEAFDRIEAEAAKKPMFKLEPAFTEDEYILVTTIFKLMKSHPGTEGKNLSVNELRKFLK